MYIDIDTKLTTTVAGCLVLWVALARRKQVNDPAGMMSGDLSMVDSIVLLPASETTSIIHPWNHWQYWPWYEAAHPMTVLFGVSYIQPPPLLHIQHTPSNFGRLAF
jgi:hypothetical protein